jgi:hypothetical protein
MSHFAFCSSAPTRPSGKEGIQIVIDTYLDLKDSAGQAQGHPFHVIFHAYLVYRF